MGLNKATTAKYIRNQDKAEQMETKLTTKDIDILLKVSHIISPQWFEQSKSQRHLGVGYIMPL